MKIPTLQRTKRRREYDAYSEELRSSVVRGWLFSKKTHRELDEEVLGLDRLISKGYQSMGILHFLGLTADFHGLFTSLSESQAITLLEAEHQDFASVIALLRDTAATTTCSLKKLIDDETLEIQRSRSDTVEARRKRLSSASKKPERIRVYSYTYRRNPDVVVEALDRAAGSCEICSRPAPFIRATDGSPFLEVHHLIPLTDGGDDSVENVVALCPNCHRKKHYGNNEQIVGR